MRGKEFTLKQSKWFCKLILFFNVLIDTDLFILLLFIFKINFGNLHLEFSYLNLDFLFLYFESLLFLFVLLNLNFQFLKRESCFKLNFFNLYQDWDDWFISLWSLPHQEYHDLCAISDTSIIWLCFRLDRTCLKAL